MYMQAICLHQSIPDVFEDPYMLHSELLMLYHNGQIGLFVLHIVARPQSSLAVVVRHESKSTHQIDI